MSRTTDTLIKACKSPQRGTGAQSSSEDRPRDRCRGFVKEKEEELEGEWFLRDEVERGSGSHEGSEGENAIG